MTTDREPRTGVRTTLPSVVRPPTRIHSEMPTWMDAGKWGRVKLRWYGKRRERRQRRVSRNRRKRRYDQCGRCLPWIYRWRGREHRGFGGGYHRRPRRHDDGRWHAAARRGKWPEDVHRRTEGRAEDRGGQRQSSRRTSERRLGATSGSLWSISGHSGKTDAAPRSRRWYEKPGVPSSVQTARVVLEDDAARTEGVMNVPLPDPVDIGRLSHNGVSSPCPRRTP